mmetsp:Transcript_4451/g.11495  ORF Transcript_4451/g.11495 Transcript_4451/m.11495 type:complete len:377 (+) Transcript_4451:888-2018(+)
MLGVVVFHHERVFLDPVFRRLREPVAPASVVVVHGRRERPVGAHGAHHAIQHRGVLSHAELRLQVLSNLLRVVGAVEGLVFWRRHRFFFDRAQPRAVLLVGVHDVLVLVGDVKRDDDGVFGMIPPMRREFRIEEGPQEYLPRHHGPLIVVGAKIELARMLPRNGIVLPHPDVQEPHSLVVVVLALSVGVGVTENLPVPDLLLVSLLDELSHLAGPVEDVREALVGKGKGVVFLLEKDGAGSVLVDDCAVAVATGVAIGVATASLSGRRTVPGRRRQKGRQIVAVPFPRLFRFPVPVPALHLAGPRGPRSVPDDRRDVDQSRFSHEGFFARRVGPDGSVVVRQVIAKRGDASLFHLGRNGAVGSVVIVAVVKRRRRR